LTQLSEYERERGRIWARPHGNPDDRPSSLAGRVSWLAREGLGEHPALSGRPPIWPLEGAHYSGRRPACSGAGLRVAVEVNKAGVRK